MIAIMIIVFLALITTMVVVKTGKKVSSNGTGGTGTEVNNDGKNHDNEAQQT